MHADVRAVQWSQRRDAFTLVEMLVVVMVIGILAASVLGIYGQTRKVTWKQQTRNMTRQLSNAWKMRLQDDHAWPDPTRFDNTKTAGNDVDFPTDVINMAALNLDANGKTNTYFELNATQWGADPTKNGLRDHWGNFLHVRLDLDSDGKIWNPVGVQSDANAINSSAVAYSYGPTGLTGNQKDWVVSF